MSGTLVARGGLAIRTLGVGAVGRRAVPVGEAAVGEPGEAEPPHQHFRGHGDQAGRHRVVNERPGGEWVMVWLFGWWCYG